MFCKKDTRALPNGPLVKTSQQKKTGKIGRTLGTRLFVSHCFYAEATTIIISYPIFQLIIVYLGM